MPGQFRRITPALKQASRQLRKRQTPMERRLWNRLCKRQLAGLHFRRQHPIGRYVVDFYCAQLGLIVEVDGESHNYQIEYDEVRTEWLAAQGCRVLRFTNEQIRHNLEGVLMTIKALIDEPPGKDG
jgi:very-short-patch-repair endonuclease